MSVHGDSLGRRAWRSLRRDRMVVACFVVVAAYVAVALLGYAESKYIAQRIPGSTFVTIPEAGHLSNFEQPDAFNQTIRSFLEKHGLQTPK